ncbi:hypothetical protein [Magnetospirillum moscoviense]|uniref:hypothetical protein n=1 Tax=Magnetospirillum moscoviense TaxID=1437059 RepID=UPI0012E8B767|nr:hypothetical protein [Magnetospirillum moscoviense]
MAATRWGQALREVRAHGPEIIRRLEVGESLRQIWIDLHGSGQVTVVLSKFYKQVNETLLAKIVKPTPAGRDLAAAAHRLMPVIASAKRECAELSAAPVVAGPTAQFVHSNRPDEDNW